MKLPFLAKGLGFPFRVNPDTGSTVVTEGNNDRLSIALDTLRDTLTPIDLSESRNHIAESIVHILLTHQGEHDTLPEFGSRVEHLLFEPNDIHTQQVFETWLQVCTQRWEKRAEIPIPNGIRWFRTPDGTDRGELPIQIAPEIIKSQVSGNLVSPFVSPRDARVQEYPIGENADQIHDYPSRYDRETVYQISGEEYIRLKKSGPITTSPDDIFHEVGMNDTWLLISYQYYGDFRYWYVIAEMYVEDKADSGSRNLIDTTGNPPVGEILRLPSRGRLLMELI